MASLIGRLFRDKEPPPKAGNLLRLAGFARPYRWQIAGASLCLLLVSAFGLALPLVVRNVIDSAFVQRDSHRLNQSVLMLVGLFAAQSLFTFLRYFLFSFAAERILADLRNRIFENLTRLSLSFFAERKIGELSSRLASDVYVLQAVITSSLGELLRQVLTLIGSIVIVFTTNPILTLIMLANVPIIVLAAWVYGTWVKRVSEKVQDALAAANSVLQESLSAIQVVQSFVREDYERARYRASVGEAMRLLIRKSVAVGSFNAFFIFMILTGIGLVVWYGSRMVIAGQLTAGQLSSFIFYVIIVIFSIGGLAELYGSVQSALGSTRRVFELLDATPEIVDPPDASPLAQVSGHVRFDSVSFGYSQGGEGFMLRDISIEARPGEIVALVGPSGAGKSSLLSLIPRFYDVQSGAISVDSHDIRTVRLNDLRHAIGIVHQETTLFGGTVRDNLAYGNPDADDAAIEAAARAAHAHEFIMQLEHGYRTTVGERGVKLSGGQRQRIAIARALLKDPAILILDEATSSLDSESERLVQEALQILMQSRTTFVIAHRLSTIRAAQTIVVLSEGRVVEQGTHEQLMANKGLYKQLHDVQFLTPAVIGTATTVP